MNICMGGCADELKDLLSPGVASETSKPPCFLGWPAHCVASDLMGMLLPGVEQ